MICLVSLARDSGAAQFSFLSEIPVALDEDAFGSSSGFESGSEVILPKDRNEKRILFIMGRGVDRHKGKAYQIIQKLLFNPGSGSLRAQYEATGLVARDSAS